MPCGLQLWDGVNGALYLDTTMLIGRLIGQIDIGTGESGSATFIGLSSGTPFALPLMGKGETGWFYENFTLPVCTFSGDTVSWTRFRPGTYPSATLPPCTLILGIK